MSADLPFPRDDLRTTWDDKNERSRAKIYEELASFIHKPEVCGGEACPFHNPSDHNMVYWPLVLRASALVERTCLHGVGHPDPDSVAWFERRGVTHMGIHGCDGCCRD